MEIRVYYEDTDISGFVYHSNYLNYCERARSDIFFQRGISPISGNSHFVVSKLNANFILSAKFGDILTIQTCVLEIKNFSVTLQQTIFRGKEKIFQAEIILAHLIKEKLAKIDEKTKQIFKTADFIS
jgi:acyl-CoA thioester hydrolase